MAQDLYVAQSQKQELQLQVRQMISQENRKGTPPQSLSKHIKIEKCHSISISFIGCKMNLYSWSTSLIDLN